MVPRMLTVACLLMTTACSPVAPTGTTVQATKTVTVTTSAGSTSAVSAASPKATPTGPKTVIETDGTYVVGVDIVPGIYRMPGGSRCYWARLNSLDTSDIIDNNNSTGPQTVDILSTDRAFLTSGCQAWTLASAPPAPVATASAAAPPVTYGAAPIALPGADSQGFVDGPRCSFRAALMVRTAQSQAVVCDDGSGSYTYKGLRLKDSARIDVPGAVPSETGFIATNGAANTRYVLSRSGLSIYADGEVYLEPAIASGP